MNKTLQVIVIFTLAVSCYAVRFYSNPIEKSNNPDPGAIYVDDLKTVFVAVTTDNNSDADKFPIRASKITDLTSWPIVSHVFPSGYKHPWAGQDFWAPEIHFVTGQYVVYYTARKRDTGMLCVGAAYANQPTGPFTDIGQPLVLATTVGFIDATYFHDDTLNKTYLIWKEDGNGLRPPEPYTPIWAQELSRDGLRLVGNDRVQLLANDPYTWEGGLVEAPWIVKHQGYYFMFYSSNVFNTDRYALGVARSQNLLGPYTKSPNNPFAHSDLYWAGPGHCSLIPVVPQISNMSPDAPQYLMFYHSYLQGAVGDGFPRTLVMDGVHFTNDHWPYLDHYSPSFGSTPIPGTY
jgi:arabinan endo-1,5-alpha-L-arabinosidase